MFDVGDLSKKCVRGRTLEEDPFPPPLIFPRCRAPKFPQPIWPKSLKDPAHSYFYPLRTLPPRKFAKGRAWLVYEHKPNTIDCVRATLDELAETYQQAFDIVTEFRLTDSFVDLLACRSSPLKDPLFTVLVQTFESESYQQMSGHLMRLRNDFGVSAPIGIISTYNHWQLCWHKYASPVAEATTIEEVEALAIPDLDDDAFDTLCVSPIYSCQDPNLKLLLASFLVKALHVPHCPPVAKPWTAHDDTGVTCNANGFDIAPLSDKMVPVDATTLFQVKFIGVGGEGCAYLMAAEDGSTCVAKVLRKKRYRTREAPFAYEIGAWTAAYGSECQVRAVKLGGLPALLMPFYEPLSKADWKRRKTMPMVMKHLEELARRGVFHRDVERRHVVWADKAKTDVRLIDWGKAGHRIGCPKSNRVVTRSAVEKCLMRVEKYLWETPERDYPEESYPPSKIKRVDVDDFGDAHKTAFNDPCQRMFEGDYKRYCELMEAVRLEACEGVYTEPEDDDNGGLDSDLSWDGYMRLLGVPKRRRGRRQ